MNVLEIILAVILLALIVDGYRLGLIKTLFSIIRMIIGVVVAAVICSTITVVVPARMGNLVPIVFIVIIGVVLGILGAVERLLNLVDKVPVARLINRIAGLPAGLIKGIIAIWIFFAVVSYFSDTQWGQQILDMMNESKRLRFVNSCNPIFNVLTLRK